MTVSIIALWWALTRDNARVGITSSSFLQVKKIIWREIKSLYRRAKMPLGGKVHDDPRTGIIFGDGNEIFGFSTSEVENAQGFSSHNNMFLLDEASGKGIETVYDALEGNIAGGGKIGMFGNPTRTSGTFFDAFTHSRSIWHAGTISSAETPNVKSGKVLIPGLATKKWIDMRLQEWGEDHPLFQIRVAGNFPKFTDNQIIPYFLVDSGQLAWRAHKYKANDEEKSEFEMIRFSSDPICIGIDVARYGQDDSVFQVVRGKCALEPLNFHGLDGVELAKEALDLCENLRESGYFHVEKVPIIIKIDEIGAGTSPYDHLRHSPRTRHLNVKVVKVNMSSSPSDPLKYADLNTEMLFGIREWLEDGGMLPEHPKLEKELLFPTFLVDEAMRYMREFNKKMERKPENLGGSPDNRDALGLALLKIRHTVSEHISDGNRQTSVAGERYSGFISEKSSYFPHSDSGNGWVTNYSG